MRWDEQPCPFRFSGAFRAGFIILAFSSLHCIRTDFSRCGAGCWSGRKGGADVPLDPRFLLVREIIRAAAGDQKNWSFCRDSLAKSLKQVIDAVFWLSATKYVNNILRRFCLQFQHTLCGGIGRMVGQNHILQFAEQ